jgi:branched-chain amino acid transport system substrate-binding protein
MLRTRRWVIRGIKTVLASGLGAGALLAAGGGASAQDLKIGVVFPFTGPTSVFGNQNYQGLEIAADYINDQGGIKGRKIVLLKGDGNSTQAAASESNRLIVKEGVKILIGSTTSAVAMVASQEAERNGAFFWEGMGVANEITTRGFQNLFRFGMNASGLGSPAPDYVLKVVAPTLKIAVKDLKVAIVAEDSGFGKDISSTVREQIKKAGAQVVVDESYSAKTTDLSPVVLKMKSTKPDVVIVTQFINDAILLQRQMKELNFVPKVFIGTGAGQATNSLGEALGDDVNGIMSSSYPPDVNEAGLKPAAKNDLREFKKRFAAKFKSNPSVQENLGFVVGVALFRDILANAPDIEPATLRKAALAADIPLGSYMNGWGMKFDATGQNVRAFGAVVQWQEKKMFVVYPSEYKLKDTIMMPLPAWGSR